VIPRTGGKRGPACGAARAAGTTARVFSRRTA
jgi:hypothetical protein